MSENKKRVWDSFSEKETAQIARNLAEQAKAGEVYCLSGDLGVGKTVFTKGFAKGLGILTSEPADPSEPTDSSEPSDTSDQNTPTDTVETAPPQPGVGERLPWEDGTVQ